MKSLKPTWMFASGTLFGLALALCLGAAPKTAAPKAPTPKPPETQPVVARRDWSQLKLIGYPNGATGIFDPATGMFYTYDADLIYCYQIRELNTLGDRLVVRR